MQNACRIFLLGGFAAAIAGTPHAHAAQFSIVADVSGGPQIGAIHGNVLYGTTAFSNPPALFSLTTTGTYTVLHSFNASTDGAPLDARLAVAANGTLYGAANGGGANGGGTIWKYSHAGVFTAPHAFGANGDGTAPLQGPTLGANGTIFGAAGEGAIGNSGNIYSLTRQGTYTSLYKFLSEGDGHCPFSGVVIGANGTLYGTTVGDGFGGDPDGSVWKFTQSGGLQTLYVFQDGTDGEWPDQAPVLDSAGNIYGTTHTQNGANFAGAIWRITAAGSFSVLHSLTAATDGFYPNSPLLIGKDGNLYGTTYSGGADNYGTVFSITPTGTFAVVHSFTAGSDGGQPTGNLVRNAGGVIFGGTGFGTVFRIKP